MGKQYGFSRKVDPSDSRKPDDTRPRDVPSDARPRNEHPTRRHLSSHHARRIDDDHDDDDDAQTDDVSVGSKTTRTVKSDSASTRIHDARDGRRWRERRGRRA